MSGQSSRDNCLIILRISVVGIVVKGEADQVTFLVCELTFFIVNNTDVIGNPKGFNRKKGAWC